MRIILDVARTKLNIVCPKCGGKVMEDIESSNFMDLHCIFCAERWFIPKQKYREFLRKKERAIREGNT